MAGRRRSWRPAAALLLAAIFGACAAQGSSPSDDPADYDEAIPAGAAYAMTVSPPIWVVPADNLPAQIAPRPSNNNVEVINFGGRLLMAWRSAPTHFASKQAKIYVVSSTDLGVSWTFEQQIATGRDLREPRFLALAGKLWLYVVELGTNPLGFEPRRVLRSQRGGDGSWSAIASAGLDQEVVWRIKTRGGRALMTSYLGEHYGAGKGAIDVLFRQSRDGENWSPIGKDRGVVYHGGVSEVAFELMRDGSLWAITRNEDGDESGFGSQLCRAKAAELAAWDCPQRSDPERYDSPALFRHGDELYLVARRDVGGPFDQGLSELPFEDQKQRNLVAYSLRPKRTAIYRVDQTRRKVIHLLDLPSAGDTAFPSVRRLGPHRFLIANYTSPLGDPGVSWLKAQVDPRGTKIYFVIVTFLAK